MREEVLRSEYRKVGGLPGRYLIYSIGLKVAIFIAIFSSFWWFPTDKSGVVSGGWGLLMALFIVVMVVMMFAWEPLPKKKCPSCARVLKKTSVEQKGAGGTLLVLVCDECKVWVDSGVSFE